MLRKHLFSILIIKTPQVLAALPLLGLLIGKTLTHVLQLLHVTPIVYSSRQCNISRSLSNVTMLKQLHSRSWMFKVLLFSHSIKRTYFVLFLTHCLSMHARGTMFFYIQQNVFGWVPVFVMSKIILDNRFYFWTYMNCKCLPFKLCLPLRINNDVWVSMCYSTQGTYVLVHCTINTARLC